jgi:hypothetical protein
MLRLARAANKVRQDQSACKAKPVHGARLEKSRSVPAVRKALPGLKARQALLDQPAPKARV